MLIMEWVLRGKPIPRRSTWNDRSAERERAWTRARTYFKRDPGLLERYLSVRKKFIVVSNTGRDNFVTAFRYHVPEGEEPDVLFLSAKRFGRVSIWGDLMESEEARKEVLGFIQKGEHYGKDF